MGSALVVALVVLVAATAAAGAAPSARVDAQATFTVNCDRPNTGITAGLFANLNNEIPDPITSDSYFQVVDTDPAVSGRPTHVELLMPFPQMSFPPNSNGVTYGTFYVKTLDITIPIPAGLDPATVTPTESPDRNYVTATRSGSNIVVHVQSPVSGSRIRINTEVATPVAEVETSSGVWVPVAMPTIHLDPIVTAAPGATITWTPPTSSNLVVKWNRDFGFLIGSVNWNDLPMPCVPAVPTTTVATTTVARPALSVSTRADETAVVAGQSIHLHVTVTNAGDVPLGGVVVTDAKAPGCAGAVGALAVGASATRDCTVTTSAADLPTFTNTAGADSDETAPVTSSPTSVSVVSPSTTGVGGQVRDGVGGQGLAGAWVALLRAADFSIAAADVADATGAYDVRVLPGSYFAYAIDPSGRHTAGFGTPRPVTVAAGSLAAADVPLAPTRGAIAGTVTDQGSRAAVAGAWALASSGTDFSPETLAVADGQGRFRLDDLAVGRHYVTFLDPAGGHAPEYLGDSPGPGGAATASVTGGGTATADGTPLAQATAGAGALVQGVVTETGTARPLADVAVVVLRGGDFSFVRGGLTDGTGAFSLTVPAGDYKLLFIDTAGTHHMEWHDGQPYTGIAAAATVTAPVEVDADLDPSRGAMTGQITADGTGVPLAGAWVLALGPGGIAGGAVTGADGRYTIDDLPAGTYRATIADPIGGRVQEYWNNAAGFGGANPITIAGGSTTTIDAALALP